MRFPQFSKRLGILVVLIGFLSVGNAQNAVAAAEVVQVDVAVAMPAPHQSLTVSRKMQSPVVVRDAWTVTEYTVVVFPVISDAISDCFGCRGGSHMGTDFVPGGGTPIRSIAEGTVVQAGYNGCYGNSVMIEHVVDGSAVTSVYGHMQDGSIAVSVGQQVRAGDLVGNVGTTGCSTGNHLHLEVRVSGVPVDSVWWLAVHMTG